MLDEVEVSGLRGLGPFRVEGLEFRGEALEFRV